MFTSLMRLARAPQFSHVNAQCLNLFAINGDRVYNPCP